MSKLGNKDLLKRNQQAGNKQHSLKNLDVINVIQSAPDTYTIKLSIDAPYNTDIAKHINISKAAHTSFIDQDGVYFPVGSGFGIPPVINDTLLQRLKKAFKTPQDNDLEYCHPYEGYAGPDLAAPSKELLDLIVRRANNTNLHSKAALLRDILKDKKQLQALQATYDVADILEHFPQLITAQELWSLQPSASMTKTYTILPEQELSKAQNKPCFSISVKAQRAKCIQNMLGESPAVERTHEGVVSSFLSKLQANDTLTIVDMVKPQKGYKAAYEANRDIVFIAQGNAHERSLSYLVEKQADKSQLKQKFILVSGFKTEGDIPQNGQFDALKQDGTLTEIYYALSRDKSASRSHGQEHYCTGKRATDILNDIDLKALNTPIFYVAGSTPFCNAVQDVITDTLGQNVDIRTSNSKARISKPAIAL